MNPRPVCSCLLAAALLALASCSSLNPPFGKGRAKGLASAAEVPRAIAEARADYEAGLTGDALERLSMAREVRGLAAETRAEIDVLSERYAARRIEELIDEGDPEGLEDLLDLSLPRQLAVTAGVAAARLRLAQGEPYKAFRLLKELEASYPEHHEREAAGEILAEAGATLARDPWSFLGFFSRRDKGIEVLEFLVLTYPSQSRCAEALFELGRLYEEDGLHELARERHVELLLSHRSHPLAVQSQARIPHLRLAAIESPEYDRQELLSARSELETWLETWSDHPLAEEVRLDLVDCLQRLALSDLSIARFYRRIGRPHGARLHGERALRTARQAQEAGLAARAEDLLASLPAVEELPEKPIGTDTFAPAERLEELLPEGLP